MGERDWRLVLEQLAKAGEGGEHPALHRPERDANLLRQLTLREPTVVRELEQPPLAAGKPPQRRADAVGGMTLLDELLRAGGGESGFDRQPAAAFLASHEVDGSAVSDNHDPSANVVTGGDSPGRAPDVEEGILHGVLGEVPIAENAEGEPVRGSPVPVVQLAKCVFVPQGDKLEKLLVSVAGRCARLHRIGRVRPRVRCYTACVTFAGLGASNVEGVSLRIDRTQRARSPLSARFPTSARC